MDTPKISRKDARSQRMHLSFEKKFAPLRLCEKSRIPLLSIVLLIFYACTPATDDTQFKTEERKALTFHRDETRVMGGAENKTVIARLAPQSLVYLTNDTLDLGGVKHVRIVWENSTGYINPDLVAPHARKGIVLKRYVITSDRALTQDTDEIIADGEFITVLNIDQDVAEVVIAVDDKRFNGYVPAATVSTDSIDFDFAKALSTAYQIDNRALIRLLEEPRWQKSKLWAVSINAHADKLPISQPSLGDVDGKAVCRIVPAFTYRDAMAEEKVVSLYVEYDRFYATGFLLIPGDSLTISGKQDLATKEYQLGLYDPKTYGTEVGVVNFMKSDSTIEGTYVVFEKGKTTGNENPFKLTQRPVSLPDYEFRVTYEHTASDEGVGELIRVSQMDIYSKGGKLIQTIPCKSVTSVGPNLAVHLEDINGDGYADLRYHNDDVAYKGAMYHKWLYDPQTEKFVIDDL